VKHSALHLRADPLLVLGARDKLTAVEGTELGNPLETILGNTLRTVLGNVLGDGVDKILSERSCGRRMLRGQQ
jgi:hypothetical protein